MSATGVAGTATVAKVRARHAVAPVYNLTVRGTSRYLVGACGMVVHNTGCGMGGAHQGPAPRVHPGKQGKHIRGHNNFVEGNSELTADPLLLARRAGTGEQVGRPALGTAGSRERIDFGFEIGIYSDDLGTVRIPTTVGMIHYAKDGTIHIIPARPSGWQ